MGQSLLEEDKVDFASRLITAAKQRGIHLLLPVDIIIARDRNRPITFKTVSVGEVPSDWYVGDIGPETIKFFSAELEKCKTAIWNGPMGINEVLLLAAGTRAMAQLLANLDATTVIGGGSTAEVVEEMKLTEKMTHVSTGGGASLRFLEGRTLPGVEALNDKDK
jgi:phosphoglycerate kinase